MTRRKRCGPCPLTRGIVSPNLKRCAMSLPGAITMPAKAACAAKIWDVPLARTPACLLRCSAKWQRHTTPSQPTAYPTHHRQRPTVSAQRLLGGGTDSDNPPAPPTKTAANPPATHQNLHFDCHGGSPSPVGSTLLGSPRSQPMRMPPDAAKPQPPPPWSCPRSAIPRLLGC